jgi:hypothetical protein
MSIAGAYAIERGGEIDIRSVSPTERAAKINWLVVHCGYPILQSCPDEVIEEAWEAFSAHYKAECVTVTIERKSP